MRGRLIVCWICWLLWIVPLVCSLSFVSATSCTDLVFLTCTINFCILKETSWLKLYTYNRSSLMIDYHGPGECEICFVFRVSEFVPLIIQVLRAVKQYLDYAEWPWDFMRVLLPGTLWVIKNAHAHTHTHACTHTHTKTSTHTHILKPQAFNRFMKIITAYWVKYLLYSLCN